MYSRRTGIQSPVLFLCLKVDWRTDEKKRRKDYGDILLELWKNKENRRPGWLFYSQCDYIVYAVLESDKIYLLPTLLLQMAWRNNSNEWLSQYQKKEALNYGYTTVNIPIPADILLNAISAEMNKQEWVWCEDLRRLYKKRKG